MTNDFYYVTQKNTHDGIERLLGYNLDKEGKDKLFYSLGKEKNSACGHEHSGDAHIRNAYGGHSTFFKSEKEAYKKLITLPNKFNAALAYFNKHGFDVVKQGLVHKSQVVVSFQQSIGL